MSNLYRILDENCKGSFRGHGVTVPCNKVFFFFDRISACLRDRRRDQLSRAIANTTQP